ncbi:hypothetical protein TNCV_3170771 [Trichonephila clavipes]|nr:hypothetical protein TNCV_3170771 [Trichonephila clavipes]
MREKGGNHLVPGPDYMVDALKLPSQAPRGYGELLQKYVFWRCPDGTQHLFCWPILAISDQSLASNGSVVNSRYLNLVFGQTEATHNKLFLSSPTKYIVESSWPLVLVWTPFELLHRTLTTIVFSQYCHVTHFSSSVTIRLRNGRFHCIWPRLCRWKFDPSCLLVLIGVAPKHGVFSLISKFAQMA